MDDSRELEEDQLESENEEKNAVSNLLEKFELPDITATNKKDKIPLALDHSQGFISFFFQLLIEILSWNFYSMVLILLAGTSKIFKLLSDL